MAPHEAALAQARRQINAALWAGEMDRAKFHARIAIGLRICAGEISVKLRNPKSLGWLDAIPPYVAA